MIKKHYSLRFLNLFYEDLNGIVDYICDELCNTDAARRLVNDDESAINKRLTHPESFEPLKTKKHRQFPYYRIYDRGFTIFYVVIDDVMEIRRMLYNHSDWEALLK